MRLQIDGQPEEIQPPQQIVETHIDPLTGVNEMEESYAPPAVGFNRNDPRTWGKISRNALCPCGSGKKYKHCHGDVAAASA